MSLLSLALFRRAVARCQHGVLDAVERQRVLQPQPELMATKAMVRRAVHAPLAQDVACCCRAQLHAQRPVLHHVVHRGDLWVWLVRMRDELKLNDARPLDVLVAESVSIGSFTLKDSGVPDPRDHEVAEFLRLPIESPDVPP